MRRQSKSARDVYYDLTVNVPVLPAAIEGLAATLLDAKPWRRPTPPEYIRAVKRLRARINRDPALRRLRQLVEDEDNDRVDAEVEAAFVIGFELGQQRPLTKLQRACVEAFIEQLAESLN